MPTLRIQGADLAFEEKDVITFSEGLLGLPQLRRMALVRQSSIEPFLWLASLDQAGVAFVVTEARTLFPAYYPSLPADSSLYNVLESDESPLVLAIVLVDADWQKSSFNLRAPLFISARAMRGAQVVLSDSSFSVAEPLPDLSKAVSSGSEAGI